MGDLLYTTGYYLFGTALKRMLTGAGLMLGVTGVSIASINALIAYIQSQFNNMPTALLSILGISGVDIALSMCLSAILTRQTLKLAKLHLMVAQ